MQFASSPPFLRSYSSFNPGNSAENLGSSGLERRYAREVEVSSQYSGLKHRSSSERRIPYRLSEPIDILEEVQKALVEPDSSLAS